MRYGTSKTIGELSEADDVRPFVNMLHNFILQVTKRDGNLYPPQFIQNSLRLIDWVIRYKQEKHILRTSVLEPLFDIFKDVRYMKVNFAGTETVKRAVKRGLGVKVSTRDIC